MACPGLQAPFAVRNHQGAKIQDASPARAISAPHMAQRTLSPCHTSHSTCNASTSASHTRFLSGACMPSPRGTRRRARCDLSTARAVLNYGVLGPTGGDVLHSRRG
eukprot:875359-Rhodomonas_salina.2